MHTFTAKSLFSLRRTNGFTFLPTRGITELAKKKSSKRAKHGWARPRERKRYDHKEDFQWISVIRLPDFVTKDDFEWAVREATTKKKQDFSTVEFFTYDEGLCVQCMHIGSYDDEPATVEKIHRFMEEQGYVLDITGQTPKCAGESSSGRFYRRMHHEIYLSDARKVQPDKLKTVIRHPIRNA